MKSFVLAVIATTGAQAAMSAEDLKLCMASFTGLPEEFKKLQPKMMAKIKEGYGMGEVTVGASPGCLEGAVATMAPKMKEAIAAADNAACQVIYKAFWAKVTACTVIPAKGASLGGCSMKIGTGDAAKRRECAAATDCCGAVIKDGKNLFEICYDKTKTEYDGSIGDMNDAKEAKRLGANGMWYARDFQLAYANKTPAELEAEDTKKKAMTDAEKKTAKEAEVAKNKVYMANKEKFECIEGATGLFASATAAIAAAYMM